MATPVVVGSTTASFTSSSSPTIPYTPTTVGNSIVIGIAADADVTVNSIEDNTASPLTYSEVVNRAATREVWIYKGDGITETDLTTWTITLSGAATGNLYLLEVSTTNDGLTVDQASSVANSTANPALVAAAGAIDTAAEVLVVMILSLGASATMTTPGTYTRVGTGSVRFFAYNTYASAQTDEGSTNNTIALSTARSGPGAIASFIETPAASSSVNFVQPVTSALEAHWGRTVTLSY